MADRLYAADLDYLESLVVASQTSGKEKRKNCLTISVAFLLALTLGTSLQANDTQTSCQSVPHWQGPFKTGLVTIGTYHVTGVPGSDRLIDATWPRSDLSPFPDVQRDDGAIQTLVFYFDPITLEPGNRYGTATLPRVDLKLLGADKFPLYSRLAQNVGGPRGELLRHKDGYTYQTAEGLVVTDEQTLEGWTQYTYPNARLFSNGEDNWFLGTPDVDGVELLLQCRNNPSGEYQTCSIVGKSEPFFYGARFDATELDKIKAIDAFVNDFISCMLEGN